MSSATVLHQGWASFIQENRMMAGAHAENLLVMKALPQIAQVFLTEWTQVRAEPGTHPQARLRADLLTVEIRNALTSGERTLAQTEAGRDAVVRLVGHWIDRAYPRLADQIESLLNCYVTSTGIDIEPHDGSVRVQIGLRASTAML